MFFIMATEGYFSTKNNLIFNYKLVGKKPTWNILNSDGGKIIAKWAFYAPDDVAKAIHDLEGKEGLKWRVDLSHASFWRGDYDGDSEGYMCYSEDGKIKFDRVVGDSSLVGKLEADLSETNSIPLKEVDYVDKEPEKLPSEYTERVTAINNPQPKKERKLFGLKKPKK